ncbi:uncharacterized protein [Asterias amurensis]|uniref:uncharacterized protein n=1 Tax=Asterias amurensis TaxID=7602 RepID=UPI003AB2E707
MVLQIPLVYGILTPWCGVIDYALVGRNYTTTNATKNQKLCYQACLKDSPRCRSANYRPKDQECDLNCASHFDVCAGGRLVEQPGSLYTFTASETIGCDIQPDTRDTNVCDIADNEPSRREDQGLEWQLVFKGVAGTGIKLYNLWTNTILDSDPENSGNCRNETLYNAWENGQLNIKQVKLSLYDQTGVQVEVIFNGKDSDISNWFDKERLVSSPWSDLTTTSHTNYFSIDGHAESGLMRRFFINMNYGGCGVDRGWLVVLDSKDHCQWGHFSSYPTILYSTHRIAVDWATSNAGAVGMADYLTIHIDTE